MSYPSDEQLIERLSKRLTRIYEGPFKNVKIGENVFLGVPAFVHDYGTDNENRDPRSHVFHGSFRRHVAVERALLFLRHRILGDLVGDACPAYEWLDSALGILFGLNCNFPVKDIALYTIWRLRGCKPVGYVVKSESVG